MRECLARARGALLRLTCMSIGALLVSGEVTGQNLVRDPSQAAQLTADFQALPSRHNMSCRITLHLRTDSTFGVRAEYQVEAPGNEFYGRHKWVTATRVVPQDRPDRVAFLAGTHVGSVSQTSGSRPFWGGWFWVGEGKYTIDLRVLDERGRSCRKEFHIEADSRLKLSLPPGAVADMTAGNLAEQLASDPRPHLKRLTLLVDAAPLWYLSTSFPLKLRPADRQAILESLLAALREIPADSIRLICFSLDQQSIVFRDDDFHLESVAKVSDALKRVDFSKVDSSRTAGPRGHLDFLEKLIKGEVHADPPADAVIFLGPQERFRDAIPAGELDTGEAGPRLFYVRSLLHAPTLTPDGSIAQAVSAMHGKTLDYRDPETLIQAVNRIRQEVLP